jgi:HipA-like protein
MVAPPVLRTLAATRYVTPLREGGSLPAIVEGEDDGLYVVKFRGAGQGARALVAELLAGELGRALGLPVPSLALVTLDPDIGRTEPDGEIRDLLKASVGLNLGVDYLPGALGYDPAASTPPPAELAANIVWFDALVLNVDRTPRNPNLLEWHRRLYCIDHGASFYVHHDWASAASRAASPFPQVKDHVLLAVAGEIRVAGERLRPRLSGALFREVADAVPDAWLPDDPHLGGARAQRHAYVEWLSRRLGNAELFEEEADRARALRV